MSEDPRIKALQEWNRLTAKNTEDAIVSSAFDAMLNSSEPLGQFSVWLLAATAAIASFLIANAEKLIPFLSNQGFLVCGGFLCASCMCGVIAKLFAVQCKIALETGRAVRKNMAEQFAIYEKVEDQINQTADSLGVNLTTGVALDRIMKEYHSVLPKWSRWFSQRHLAKHKGSPQVGFILPVRCLHAQSLFVLLQATSVIGFLASGFVYAAAI